MSSLYCARVFDSCFHCPIINALIISGPGWCCGLKLELFACVTLFFLPRVRLWTSALIGAWNCNFPSFLEIKTDERTNEPTDQPTEQQTDRRDHREVSLQISGKIIVSLCARLRLWNTRQVCRSARGSWKGAKLIAKNYCFLCCAVVVDIFVLCIWHFAQTCSNIIFSCGASL